MALGNLGNTLRDARKLSKLTLKEVATALEMSHQAVQQIESGKTVPRLETILSMSRLYKRSLDDMLSGSINNASQITTAARLVPVIHWSLAASWEKLIQTGYSAPSGDQVVTATSTVGPNAFALIVQGDSMANPSGTPSFPEGTTIICDPDEPAKNGSYVICAISEVEITFKKLVIDGGKRFLQPINPRYPMLEIDDSVKITAVVKEARMAL